MWFKVGVLSRTHTWYLTLLLSSMRSGPALSGSCAALLSWCFDPNNMHSVLSEFSLSGILSIQPFIPLNVSSSNCLVVVSCRLFLALNDFCREWSSAKPFILTDSGTSLLMREQLQVKMFPPLQDPCGTLKLNFLDLSIHHLCIPWMILVWGSCGTIWMLYLLPQIGFPRFSEYRDLPYQKPQTGPVLSLYEGVSQSWCHGDSLDVDRDSHNTCSGVIL